MTVGGSPWLGDEAATVGGMPWLGDEFAAADTGAPQFEQKAMPAGISARQF